MLKEIRSIPTKIGVTLVVLGFLGFALSGCVGMIVGIAALTASPTAGVAPLTVQFTDQSTGTPMSWLWDFGDGTQSTEQNPQHTYYDPATNRMIVFGGFVPGPWPTYSGDTWILTNANGLGGTPTWIQISPTGPPPQARALHGVVYNKNTKRMILFGGEVGAGGVRLNDVWVLTNADGSSP